VIGFMTPLACLDAKLYQACKDYLERYFPVNEAYYRGICAFREMEQDREAFMDRRQMYGRGIWEPAVEVEVTFEGEGLEESKARSAALWDPVHIQVQVQVEVEDARRSTDV